MQILDAVFVYELSGSRALAWHGRFHRHGPGEYEVHYFVQGLGSFKNRDSIRQVEGGSVVLCGPLEDHAVHSSDISNPVCYYAVLIRLEEGDAELEAILNQMIREEPHRKIGTHQRFLFEEIKEKCESESDWVRKSGVHQLLSFIYLLMESSGQLHGSHSVHVERAVQLMQRHVFGNLTIKDLAEKLGLSQGYLIRLFSRTLKMTPKQYFQKLKIEAAISMLITTTRPVYQIADSLHFSSEFHFSRVFKSSTGLPPTEYREAYAQVTPDTIG